MTEKKPLPRVAILALPEATASVVYGMLDMFCSAGRDCTRVRGGGSQLWAFSPIAGAVDTAVSTHSTRYETGYVLFALPLRRERNYYVTATFDGDRFMPRIVETNAAEERTSEILPAGSMQELERCKAQAPSVSASEQEVCAVPLNQSPERKW